MEEKKFDPNSLIGFVLIGAILIWVMYTNQPDPAAEAETPATTEQVVSQPVPEAPVTVSTDSTFLAQDSLQLAQLKSTLGAFAYSATLPGENDGESVLENEVLKVTVSHKGGQITEAVMKKFNTYDSVPVYLVKDGNASLNLTFQTTDNRTLNTSDLNFTPELSEENGSQVLSMRLKAGENQFLEYRYTLKPNDYLMDFTIRSQGLNGILNTSVSPELTWKQKQIRHSKSIEYENRYTRLTYMEDGTVSKLNPTGSDDDEAETLKWISYRQHFFSTILAAENTFKKAKLTSEDLVTEESDTARFTKDYAAVLPLEFQAGELSIPMKWYYGPTDFKVLKQYEGYNFDESVPFGWGIFGFINKYVFTPLYDFLAGVFPYGIAIIVMTVLVRLLMSPITYKSYLSQAKMKVLRPEISEINEKFKDNPMKRQQETMKLYGKAGVNPMSGCIPALLQLPIFYALFMFFPTAFMLRQKPFLWAEDLASYDTIAKLPFTIPFYGDHISLFPILASVAIFFYMKMTTGQQMMQQPTQEGMPDMGAIMKVMIYISPLLMLFFFNNYASGLSLYYFVSNLITILIMLVIKNYILDEDKIHAQIQENKQKPKKENKFQRRMREMMEQAEAQQKGKKK